DARHVVLKAKELAVARPHGQILRSGQDLMPDGETLSVACFAAGAFASQLAVGNSRIAVMMTRVRAPLNIIRSSGLRMFIRENSSADWRLLSVPSAFEMG